MLNIDTDVSFICSNHNFLSFAFCHFDKTDLGFWSENDGKNYDL